MLEILTGEQQPVLRQRAKKVKNPLSNEIRILIPEMIDTMRQADGTGLAAPQVGKSIRLFIVEVEGRISVFINPVITKKSEKSVFYEEGCLSLPGLFFDIERAERITLDYQNQHGDKKTLTANGLLAIVIQHEMDHLDGILIVDRDRSKSKKRSPWISDLIAPKRRAPGSNEIAKIDPTDPSTDPGTLSVTHKDDQKPEIRVVFMGTPDFSAKILGALIESRYHLVAAYTKPDMPSGRKKEIVPSAVKTIATAHGIPVEQPKKFDEAAIAVLRAYKPDLIIVAAYGKILPKAVLDLPELGCINTHASLLPRWRGASPIQNALLSGDKETGITIMLMNEGMDTGDIIATRTRIIDDDDTYDSLHSKLSDDACEILIRILPHFIDRKIEPIKQDIELATLCQLIERDDGRIFWNDTAKNIRNRFRGLSPWPGIFSFWKQQDGSYIRLKFPRISIQETQDAKIREFGEVFGVDSRIAVQTGEGLVFIEEIQPEGKSTMSIRDFLNGRPDFPGSTLG